MNDTSARYSNLGEAFAYVVGWYLGRPEAHVHASLSLTCADTTGDGPVKHFAYVEHCDHQRQLLATLEPVPGVTIVGSRPKVDWFVTLEDLCNPVWLTQGFKSRGCGPRRYTVDEAIAKFEEHAAKHHPDLKVTFVGTSPGRVVVRLGDSEGAWRPYGVILDERVIRGERVLIAEPAVNVGIDIYG